MTKFIKVDPMNPEWDAVCTIAHEIIHGKVIVYPTDTIYGIGADACNPDAVERVFAVKKRDPGKPMLILVNSVEMAAQVAETIPEASLPIIEKFWPGPLTLIFRASSCLSSRLTGGTYTVGIRYPLHPFCIKVLEVCRRPITSTSANISGEEPPRSIGEITRIFESIVDLIVDGGDVASLVPSSVVDVTGAVPRLVREGAIRRAVLEPFLKGER